MAQSEKPHGQRSEKRSHCEFVVLIVDATGFRTDVSTRNGDELYAKRMMRIGSKAKKVS